MDFKDILQRYHISPLKYDDNTLLTESDYFELSNMLLKYYYSKKILGCQKLPKISDKLINRVDNHCKRSLLDIELTDLMDILMEQEGGNVL